MDLQPSLIIALSQNLLAQGAKTSEVVHNLVQSTHGNDAIQLLGVEIDSLTQVTNSLRESYPDTPTWSPHENQHWHGVQQLLQNCTQTLNNVDTLLENAHKNGWHIFQTHSKLQAYLGKHNDDIRLFQQQITASRQTLQISIQLITMYSPPFRFYLTFFGSSWWMRPKQEGREKLPFNLDNVATEIQRLSMLFHTRSKESNDIVNLMVLQNLQDCLHSAGLVISAALSSTGSTVLSSGHSHFGKDSNPQSVTEASLPPPYSPNQSHGTALHKSSGKPPIT
jgi:hypothetical protein